MKQTEKQIAIEEAGHGLVHYHINWAQNKFSQQTRSCINHTKKGLVGPLS